MIMCGMIGRKLGMTRFFNVSGISVPVSLVELAPNYITQVKNSKKDGYCAIQVTTGDKKLDCFNKPELGHLKKSGVRNGGNLWEFRTDKWNLSLVVGDSITIKMFKYVKKVDITGFSKGKGFSGTVKRWNFCMQDASHGNSLSHRAPGSIGQNQTPGKVFKGKKMAGQLGNKKVTIQNLEIVHIDIDNNLLLVKGAIPGRIGENVIIKKSIKIHTIKENGV